MGFFVSRHLGLVGCNIAIMKQQLLNRLFGISGILGGIILFCGDMLIYYSSTETNLLINMSVASDTRIIASGVCALFSSWLYLLGAFHIDYAFQPTKPLIKNSVLFCFGSIGIAYGIVHAEYIAIATSASLAVEHNINLQSSVILASQTNQVLRMIIYPIFGLLSVLFIYSVWKKKTLYPQWIILFYPLIPFLLKNVISDNLSGITKVVLIGGYLNIMLIIFYTASTISLWNKIENS